MSTTVELITPVVAESYLKKNERNRKLRSTIVARYAADMRSGSWQLTHQGIAFDSEGRLLDGQHRLAAIVESGVPVFMTVTRGLDSVTQIVMDQHAKRSASDSITLFRGVIVSKRDVAIIRAAVEPQIGIPLSVTAIEEIVDSFESPLSFVREFSDRKTKGVTAAPTWGAVACAWFYVPDLARLRSFCRILAGDEFATCAEDSAAVRLREHLIKTGSKGGSLRREIFFKSQRAIFGFLAKEKTKAIRSSTTAYYPWPLVEPVRM